MPQILTGILVLLMAGAVTAFAVMGVSQIRRRRKLAALAHRLGMKFSPEDPFDIPRRYMDFGLIRSGHSPRAYNVLYGRCDGIPVRLFDFRYEIGHGTRRLARHYAVVVAEASVESRNVVLWHQSDAEGAPLETRQVDGYVENWSYRGDDGSARALAQACQDLTGLGLSVESHEQAVLFCRPVSLPDRDPSACLDAVVSAVARLQRPTDLTSRENLGVSGR